MTLAAFLRENARWLSAGALLSFSSSWGQTYFIALFAGQVQADYGLSHGQWGAIYAAGTTVSAAVMIWAGTLTDRFRVRALAPAVLAGLALACLAMAFNPFVWLLPVVIFALRLTGQGMTSHIAMVAMARWFTRTRGKALSVATLGFALGEAVLPLVFVSLLAVAPWRSLWVLAALVALAAIPLLRGLLTEERTPQSMAEENQSAGMHNRHWTRAEMLRGGLFWLMLPSVLAPSAFVTAFFFHQVHLAQTKALSHVQLVALFPLYTLAGIAAMIASGWAIDRFGSIRLMPLYQVPLAAGFALIGLTDGIVPIAAGLALIACTTGANSTLPGAFWAEVFGTRHLGAIKSAATAAMVLGSALGPAATGTLIDFGFDFPTQMLGISAIVLLACLLTTMAILKARSGLAVAPQVDVVSP